jgi:hypothetical protein
MEWPDQGRPQEAGDPDRDRSFQLAVRRIAEARSVQVSDG